MKIQLRSNRIVRNGYTLIEMTAAVALAAMLMVAVMGILNSIVMRQSSLLSDRRFEVWHDRLTAQLEWDLTNSREIRSTANVTELVGFAGRDCSGKMRLHIPATIRYITENTGRMAVLVRQEVHHEAGQDKSCQAEIIGVETGRLIFLNVIGERSASAKSDENGLEQIANGNIPPKITAVLLDIQTGEQVYCRTFVLR